jgi:general secretion pathway protein H
MIVTASLPDKRQAGFTLLEMLVVLVVLGLMVGLIVARSSKVGLRLGPRAATGQVVQMLRLARSQAISDNRGTTFVVDVASGSFAIDGGRRMMLPAGIAIDAVTQTGLAKGNTAIIQFDPDGGSSGGHIDLASASRHVRIGIDWLTGRVSVLDAI